MELARFNFKIGIYSQLCEGDHNKSLNHIRASYDELKLGGSSTFISSRQAFEEKRDNADIVMLQLLVLLQD